MQNHNTLKELPESERPYEKYLAHGEQALSDAELLAIILKTGTKQLTSIDVARNLLSGEQGNLLNLYKLSFEELLTFKGIGKVKAIQLKAIAELSKRISKTMSRERLKMDEPCSIAAYYMEQLRHEAKESLICALFNSKCVFLGDSVISIGSDNYAYVSPKDIFQFALDKNAVLMILVHNHPSGDPNPSEDDVNITRRIKNGADLLGLELADHIIIGDNDYFSFREHGYI